MVKMKKHPTLGIMVRSDGLILLPGYYFGKGIVKENKRRGLYYMVEAAEAGFVHAMRFLTTVYYEEEQFADCVYWAEQAAKSGDVQAQAYIGKCYYDGFYVDMNKASFCSFYHII